jgi:flagellar operon protein
VVINVFINRGYNVNGLVNKNKINSKGHLQEKSIEKDSFQDILKGRIQENQELKFSKHAEARLKERNINLTNEQKDKLQDAVKKAEDKGVKESLVLLDNIAFVVSIKNKTVVTAVNDNDMKDNVFTKIDGAVIV